MMDRKKFLITSSLAAFSLSFAGNVIAKPDGSFEGECATTRDILGPFYRAGAPMRSDLTFDGLPGTRISLKGTVYGPDCVTPVKNSLVEIWHCSTEGEYDNESDGFLLRGAQKTDGKGQYGFTTILPGKYLNGRLYRPAHIHYRVTAPGTSELVSQIYFKGDPHIEEDPWASHARAEKRILPIVLEDINGNLAVNFDVYLKRG